MVGGSGRETLSNDHRKSKKLHDPGCVTTKMVFQELISAMNATLQDSDALLCHSCELRSTSWKRRLTKIMD